MTSRSGPHSPSSRHHCTQTKPFPLPTEHIFEWPLMSKFLILKNYQYVWKIFVLQQSLSGTVFEINKRGFFFSCEIVVRKVYYTAILSVFGQKDWQKVCIHCFWDNTTVNFFNHLFSTFFTYRMYQFVVIRFFFCWEFQMK